MLNREKQETVLTVDMDEEAVMQEWDTPFSAQYTFESFMHGGPKYLCTLNAKMERMLKAPDGSTTEQYKNKQRERESVRRHAQMGNTSRIGRGYYFASPNAVSSCESVCCTLAFTTHCGYCVSHDYGRTIKKYSRNTDIPTQEYPYAIWTNFEIQMDPDTRGRYTFQVRWMQHALM